MHFSAKEQGHDLYLVLSKFVTLQNSCLKILKPCWSLPLVLNFDPCISLIGENITTSNEKTAATLPVGTVALGEKWELGETTDEDLYLK